ncbi:MAG: hypothetical protein HC844_12360 [Tabrizicola sp.]|nr:hypothetical protein [Tabrizicola sp.]
MAATLLIATAYVVAVGGLVVHLGQRFGAVTGAAIIAGAALLLALGLILAVRAANRADRRRERDRSRLRRTALAMSLRILPAVLMRRTMALLAVAALVRAILAAAHQDGGGSAPREREDTL